jgi:hypothetical protein
MSRSFSNLGITVLIAMVSSVVLLNWLVNDDATKSFLTPTVDEYKQAGINHLGIEFKDKVILLNVTLDKPMSCKQVFGLLDIGDLPLKGKVYSPVCTLVQPALVVITYKETTPV